MMLKFGFEKGLNEYTLSIFSLNSSLKSSIFLQGPIYQHEKHQTLGTLIHESVLSSNIQMIVYTTV